MSGEILRRAAALMRERAEAATPGPWSAVPRTTTHNVQGHGRSVVVTPQTRVSMSNTAHIASWHPSVALAVADWLDREATLHESMAGLGDLLNLASKELGGGEIRIQFSDDADRMAASTMPQALAVAHAYLGEQR